MPIYPIYIIFGIRSRIFLMKSRRDIPSISGGVDPTMGHLSPILIYSFFLSILLILLLPSESPYLLAGEAREGRGEGKGGFRKITGVASRGYESIIPYPENLSQGKGAERRVILAWYRGARQGG